MGVVFERGWHFKNIFEYFCVPRLKIYFTFCVRLWRFERLFIFVWTLLNGNVSNVGLVAERDLIAV